MRTCIIIGCGDGIGKAAAYSLRKTDYFDSYALLGRNKEAILRTIGLMDKDSKAL